MILWESTDGIHVARVVRLSAYRGEWYVLRGDTVLARKEVFLHYAAYLGPTRENQETWTGMANEVIDAQSKPQQP